jgi:glycosyltransferase involved in cell wall biosynthesis
MQPLVSVGIPTYNNPKGLKRTLECITNQTYKNIEVVISDDCSINIESKEVIESFRKDPRFRIYYQEYNLGVPKNFMFVRTLSTGKYYMCAQDDDYWTPTYIENLVAALEANPDIPVAVGTSVFINAAGNPVRTSSMKGVSVFKAIGDSRMGFIYMGLWRREELNDFEYFSETVIGGDHIVASEAIMAHDKGFIVVESEMYFKGLRNDALQNYFKADPFYRFRVYIPFVKRLATSKHIPDERKLLVPIIALTNLAWIGCLYGVQMMLMLPKDNLLRKVLRSQWSKV